LRLNILLKEFKIFLNYMESIVGSEKRNKKKEKKREKKKHPYKKGGRFRTLEIEN